MNSTELTARTSTILTTATGTPSLSNGTNHTSPMSNHDVPYEDSRNKMNISSLLDAAAVIDKTGPKRKIEEALDGDDESVSSCSTVVKRQQVEEAYRLSRPAMEDKSCDTWDQVERNFTNHVAVFLDELLTTNRFGRMAMQGKARASGLPLDGNGTVAIPCNSSNTLSGGMRSASVSSNGSGYGSSGHSTVVVGQNIAMLEAVRQMLGVLCPNFYLNNLSIDEGSVGKLEELRISNDFRLLRAVVQLITATKDTQFLSVCDKDQDLLLRIQALHKFITGFNGEIQGIMPQGATSSEDVEKTKEEVEEIFQRGLDKADAGKLWKLLTFIATPGRLQEVCKLTHIQENALLDYVITGGSSGTGLRVPLLLGAHYYLLTRRPPQHMNAGRDSNLRLLLLESCATQVNNVVARRLVNMILN